MSLKLDLHLDHDGKWRDDKGRFAWPAGFPAWDANVCRWRDERGQFTKEPEGEEQKKETAAEYLTWDEDVQRWRCSETGKFAKAPTSKKTWDVGAKRWRDATGKFTTAPDGEDEKTDIDSTAVFFDEDAQRWRDRQTGRFAKAPTSEKTWDPNVQRWRSLKGAFTTAPEDEPSTPQKSKALEDDAPRPEKTEGDGATEKPKFIFKKDGKIDKRCKAFKDGYVLLKDDGDVDKRCKAFKDGYVNVLENGTIDTSCEAYQSALKSGDAHDNEK